MERICPLILWFIQWWHPNGTNEISSDNADRIPLMHMLQGSLTLSSANPWYFAFSILYGIQHCNAAWEMKTSPLGSLPGSWDNKTQCMKQTITFSQKKTHLFPGMFYFFKDRLWSQLHTHAGEYKGLWLTK